MTLKTDNLIVRISNLSGVNDSHNKFLVPFLCFSRHMQWNIRSRLRLYIAKTFRVQHLHSASCHLEAGSISKVRNTALELIEYLLFLQHHVAANQG